MRVFSPGLTIYRMMLLKIVQKKCSELDSFCTSYWPVYKVLCWKLVYPFSPFKERLSFSCFLNHHIEIGSPLCYLYTIFDSTNHPSWKCLSSFSSLKEFSLLSFCCCCSLAILGIEPRASSLLGKHSNSWAIPPAQAFWFFFGSCSFFISSYFM